MAVPTYNLYDRSNYTCRNLSDDSGDEMIQEDEEQVTVKPPKMERLRSYFQQKKYSADGTVKSVRAIILAFSHRHPHLFLLSKESDSGRRYIIPGGKLLPGEDYETGLKRILDKKLAIVEGGSYEIADQLVATWYRPQFGDQMLPYLPVHITSAKEIEEWYLVLLPKKAKLQVKAKYGVSWASFYQLQAGTDCGPQLSKVPVLVSRFNFEEGEK